MLNIEIKTPLPTQNNIENNVFKEFPVNQRAPPFIGGQR